LELVETQPFKVQVAVMLTTLLVVTPILFPLIPFDQLIVPLQPVDVKVAVSLFCKTVLLVLIVGADGVEFTVTLVVAVAVQLSELVTVTV
jgi:hypothetical protein